MGLGLVSIMKKFLVKSLILFAVNLSFIAFFLVTDIPKYTTIIILFLDKYTCKHFIWHI